MSTTRRSSIANSIGPLPASHLCRFRSVFLSSGENPHGSGEVQRLLASVLASQYSLSHTRYRLRTLTQILNCTIEFAPEFLPVRIVCDPLCLRK